MIKYLFLITTLIFLLNCSFAQNRTVGILLNDSLSDGGYTLFSPGTSMETYLIDNCGHEINKWEAQNTPGLSSYLLNDGSLLRTGRVPGSFNAGGSGGLIEIYNWEGDLTWTYRYGNSEQHQHHDVEPLPNGNILVIAWERKSQEEAIANGRDTNKINSAGLWPDKIVELKPVGADSSAEVWEWRAWDHLIQEFDSTKSNYGIVADQDELIHLNYIPRVGSDWLHTNSVEYIQERDEILLSVKHHHEIWVIDHSTTRAESRSHSGGNRGKGGDLLFRWGNPQAYQKAAPEDQILFGQHSAKWLPSNEEGPGQIVLFNNGVGRGNYSSIDVVEPTIDDQGNYVRLTDGTYGPDSVTWEYVADPPESLFNSNQGGVSYTSDGHFIVSNTRTGEFFEVNQEKEVLWRYISPVNFDIVVQGNAAVANGVFRVERYAANYPGLADKDLTPGELIETDPLPEECTLYPIVVSATDVKVLEDVSIFPTVTSSIFTIVNANNRTLKMNLLDAQGRLVGSRISAETHIDWFIDNLSIGMYFMHISDAEDRRYLIAKIIKV